jgi:adenylate kinase
MEHISPKNYILLGPPGSGKSTQATLLKKKYHLAHVDVGSELRRLAESGSELGNTINEVINVRKELMSDGLIGDVIKHVISSLPSTDGVLIDGAPRRLSQIDEVEEALALYKRDIDKIIFLDIKQAAAVLRISKRFMCQECKAPYIGSPESIKELGACAVCGGPIGQRVDDTPEGVAKRYAVFMEQTLPVIEHYAKKDKLLRIDAELSPEEIASKIEKAFE